RWRAACSATWPHLREDGAARTGGGFGREKAKPISGDTRMLASRQPGRPGTEMTVHGKAAYEEKTVRSV
ncbi:hypothetical protein, partial [Burkholderia ambifaria]|uniref:hypothetical protein n=1 Tax=Burkholderia ambifaria TaxID=152480 RepID=UPI001E5487BB